MNTETEYDAGYKAGMAWGSTLTTEEKVQLANKVLREAEGDSSAPGLIPPQRILEMGHAGEPSEAWLNGFVAGFTKGLVAGEALPEANQ